MTAAGLHDPTPPADAREFWRGVLASGGATAVPRWNPRPVPGTARTAVTVPPDLAACLRLLAGELPVPLSSVLLAAHAKVLAALSGQQRVTAGYRAAAGAPVLPCPLMAGPGTWRDLLLAASRAEAALLACKDFPVAALGRELGLTGPRFETVLRPAGGDSGLPAGTVLSAGFGQRDGGLVLRLRYRTDVLDAACAGRIAHYHLAALTLMAADPGAGHDRQSLLSERERRFQIQGLAGPHRALPGHRAHELFQQQAAALPDAIAVADGDRAWTYAELNAAANRIGRALLARGLRREEAVAVVTGRTLDWAAAVLGVFKAGGAYLPADPGFPPDRMTAILSRAGCRLALAQAGRTASLDAALGSLPGTQRLLIDAACAGQEAAGNLGVPVSPGQLAYIYFTSGSTGEPKGAMCEHAGLLNHLLAKITDLEIAPGAVVAQTAPQCFDISLWQLLSALLAGGRTLLVGQKAILDARRFVDTIAGGQVTVLQVVPSYLEAILSCLERHPRELPSLRYVCVTGEALKTEIARRWFAAQPRTRLVNAYGLTETSDDTNHEIMDRAPDAGPVPLGRPVPNVHAYVVDEHLDLVPLGAPGAIVFSGICVGRGYVNDPGRTRQAFTPDPHRPGQRLYQAGDYGRWRPDGKLEYLGRRDSQVKISGFRIETCEVENALLRAPGVRDGAVVVAERPGRPGRLVAFYASPGPLEPGALRAFLARSLPAYMIPSAFRWRHALPLTANGKTDRKALTALAGDSSDDPGHRRAPRTPTERRLAAAWADVLGIPADQVGPRDSFFALGGTSLSAVKLAVALDRSVTLAELAGHPVLADLAGLIDRKSRRAARPSPGRT